MDSPERVNTRQDASLVDGTLSYIEAEERLVYAAGDVLEDVPKMSEVGGGSGSGDMLAANNLSELNDVSAARDNLELGDAALASSNDFDPAGAAANALTQANAYTDAHGGGGGGLPQGDLHPTGRVFVPAVFGPQYSFENDTDTGWGYREPNTLSAFSNGQERLRIGGSVALYGVPFDINGPYQAQSSTHFVMDQIPLSGVETESPNPIVPLNCVIEAIMVVVTATIVGATSLSVKVSGGNPFVRIGTNNTSASLASGSNHVFVPAAFADQFNSQPAKVTITADAVPSSGALRVLVLYKRLTPTGA